MCWNLISHYKKCFQHLDIHHEFQVAACESPGTYPGSRTQVTTQVLQPFTGMNVIMYYAPKIFGMAGFAISAGPLEWGMV
jgi:hypothetical protein